VSLSAPIAAFAGGLASSVGPCAAPRFLAAASLCADTTAARGRLLLVSFAAGLCVSYVLAFTAGSALARLSAISPYAYAVVGVWCIGSGVAKIFAGHRCRRRQPKAATFGVAFLSGAAFVGITSPCCGPLAIAAGMGMQGSVMGIAAPAAFALGHALPLAGLALGWRRFDGPLRFWPAYATQTVAAAVAMAVGGFYWLLA
jgi:cytochrome c biogenesis protein CcdA